MKILRYFFYTLSVLIMLGLYAVLCTRGGLQLTLDLADKFSDAKISATVNRGSLYYGAEIHDLHYEDAQLELSIDELALRWQVFGLLKGHWNFTYLTAINTRILTHESAPKQETAGSALRLPPLSVELLTLDKLTLLEDEQAGPQQLDGLQLTLTWTDGHYNFQDVHIKKAPLTVYGSATLEWSEPFTLVLMSQLVVALDDKKRVSADLHLHGQADKLSATLHFHDNLQGEASLQVSDLLNNPLWAAQVKLEDLQPQLFNPALPALRASGAIDMSGDMRKLQGRAETQIQYSSAIAGKAAASRNVESDLQFAVDFSTRDIIIELQKWRLASDEGELDINGSYNYSREQVDVEARWDKLSWPLNVDNEFINSSGSLSLLGTLNDYRFNTEMTLGAIMQVPPFQVSARGSGTLESLRLQDARISILDGSVLADADINWSEQGQLRLNWKANNLNPAKHWQQWPGHLQSTGSIVASGNAEHWQWQLLPSTVTGRLLDSNLQLDASAEGTGADSATISAQAIYADTGVELEGTVGERLQLKWQLNSPDLSRLRVDLQGHLQSHGKLTGSRAKPAIEASLSASALRSPWGKAEGLEAEVNFDAAEDALIRADVKLADIHYQDREIAVLDLKLDGRNSQHNFALKTVTEGIELELAGTGRWQDRDWSARIASLQLTEEKLGQWQTQAGFGLDYLKGLLRVQLFCLQQAGMRVCAGGEYQQNSAAWRVAAQAVDIPLSLWPEQLPDGIVVDGLVQAEVEMKGEADKPVSAQGRLTIPQGSIDIRLKDDVDNHLVLDQSVLTFSLADTVFSVETNIPPLAHGIKPLYGTVQLAGISSFSPLAEQLAVKGRLQTGFDDLASLSVFVPQLVEVKGRVVVDMQVQGTLASPDFDGRIVLSDGGFSSTDLGIEVKKVALAGSRLSDSHYEIRGELHSGEGKLDLRAFVGGQDASAAQVDVNLTGDGFELVNLPELWALVKPDLRAGLRLSGQMIEGDIRIPQAKINLDEVAMGSTLSDDEIVNGMEVADKTGKLKRKVDLRVILGDKVVIGGKGISGELVGEIRISSNKQGLLTADGEIAIKNGLFAAYGQKLDISEGRLIFTRSALDNPALSIIATRSVDGIKVGLKISGYSNDPQIALFSSSSLPQEQILSYIVFGRSLNNLSSGEGADLLGAAASMGLQNSGFITGKVAARFGLDQFGISGSNAQSASLVIGKYLNPKLYLSYGLGIFDKISTAKLRYELSRRFSVEAERGAETGVDIFYELER